MTVANAQLDEIPVSAAAQRLRLSMEATKRRILKGDLDGRQVMGRWIVTEASVRRLEREMAAQAPAGAA